MVETLWGSASMQIEYGPGFTQQQRTLADRIGNILRMKKLRNTKRETLAGGNGPCYSFGIHTSPDLNLSVELILFQDSFHVIVNECKAIFKGTTWKNTYDLWADHCCGAVSSLVDHELRIRVRPKLLGKRTGAIWFEGLGGGGWSGDRLCVLGLGKTHTYTPWRAAP